MHTHRYRLNDDVVQVLLACLPEVGARLAGIEARSVRLLRQRHVRLDRSVDALLLVEDRDGRGLPVHIEFETTPRPSLPWRMLAYNVLVRSDRRIGGNRLRPVDPLRSIAVWLGPPVGEVPDRIELADGTWSTPSLVFRYEVVRLYERPASELAVDPLLAALAPLGRDFDAAAIERAARTIAERYAPEEGPGPELADILWSLTERERPELAPVARIVMGGIGLRVRDMVGFREGLEEGRREGLEEGRAGGLREALLRVLGARFGEAGSVAGRLESLPAEELERLLEEAVRAPDLAAFLRVLSR